MPNTKPECKSIANAESEEGWVLLPEQMEHLRKNTYMYNATAGSFLEILFLQRFWTKLAEFVPLHTAPCILTCAGLLINVFCCSTLLYYGLNLEGDIPAWALVLCAIGVFVYGTLDALDGKQALKVQNTQIEEVYDHGCDAVSTVFVSISCCAALRLASCPILMFSFFLASSVAFFTTHWQDHVTHVMIFGMVDVSEAQFTAMGIHLSSAIFGQNIWLTPLLFNIQPRHILGTVVLISMVKLIALNVLYVCGKKTALDQYVEIPRKQGSHIWNPVVPGVILTLCFIRVYTSGTFEFSSCLCMIAFGLAYAKITLKLVTCNVTNADMDIWDSGLVAPILVFINTYVSAIPICTALLCAMVYNLMDFARYFTYLSWDLREALDVWIFSLKYPPNHPKNRNGNYGFYMNGINNDEIKELANQHTRDLASCSKSEKTK